MGQVEMVVNGVSLLLENVLFVPGLGVNLLSSRKLCAEWNCLGNFNDKSMWFTNQNNEVIIQADVKDGLYYVSRIMAHSQGIKEIALISTPSNLASHLEFSPAQNTSKCKDIPEDFIPCCHVALTVDEIQEYNFNTTILGATGNSKTNRMSQREMNDYYNLMHRRFSHMGSEKLRNLHKVTNLKRPIVIPIDKEICRVCKLTKLRNRTNKVCSPWKESILALVSIDIAGPFLPSLRGNTWFCEIVDNSTRRAWTLLGKTKSDLMDKIEKWRKEEELATNLRLVAVRSDNAAEIRQKLDQWSSQGIRHEVTIPYEGSHQNGIAERRIQEVESGIRSLLKDAGLPLEFWDWAAEHNTYLWNIMPHGPVVDGVRLTPKGAYEDIIPDINHVRVFGCVCYSYISPKSWPAGTKSRKLLDRGRECVFVGHNEKTNNQYWVYAPDLGRAELAKTVDFDEQRKGGDLDLRIRQSGGATSHGLPFEHFTSSAPPMRNPVGRPKRQLALQPTMLPTIPVSYIHESPPNKNSHEIVNDKPMIDVTDLNENIEQQISVEHSIDTIDKPNLNIVSSEKEHKLSPLSIIKPIDKPNLDEISCEKLRDLPPKSTGKSINIDNKSKKSKKVTKKSVPLRQSKRLSAKTCKDNSTSSTLKEPKRSFQLIQKLIKKSSTYVTRKSDRTNR